MNSMEDNAISLSMLDNFSEATAGQDILRYIGLPSMLGHEKNDILYFFGRNFARQFDITEMDDIDYIFQKLNWGNIELIKVKKHQLTFHLMADVIAQRLALPVDPEFRIEAGFIAEIVQKLNNRPCECMESVNKRLFRVEFTVHFTD